MQPHCAAEYKLCCLMEAVSRTLARAKSGLHRAFVIRAGFLLPVNLQLGEEGERLRKMKADLRERNKGQQLVVKIMQLLFRCHLHVLRQRKRAGLNS